MDEQTTPILSTKSNGDTVNSSKGMTSQSIPQRPEHKSPETMLGSMRQMMGRAVAPEKCCQGNDE